MKKQLIILFVILAQSGWGQSGIEKDSVLMNIKSELPKGWIMKINDTTLVIERVDSVWIIYTNHINEPVTLKNKRLTDNELRKVFEKNGKKKKYSLTYRIGPKWSVIKLDQAKIHNDAILSAVGKLWDKYEIEKFYHRAKITRGKRLDVDSFEPKTKDDSLKLEKYQAEKEQLDKRMIIMPDKSTEYYSIFPPALSCDDRIYYNSVYTDVYPTNADGELSKVCNVIRNHCEHK